jgi:hypothetical protein
MMFQTQELPSGWLINAWAIAGPPIWDVDAWSKGRQLFEAGDTTWMSRTGSGAELQTCVDLLGETLGTLWHRFRATRMMSSSIRRRPR